MVEDPKDAPKPPEHLNLDSAALKSKFAIVQRRSTLVNFRFGTSDYDRWAVVYGRVERRDAGCDVQGAGQSGVSRKFGDHRDHAGRAVRRRRKTSDNSSTFRSDCIAAGHALWRTLPSCGRVPDRDANGRWLRPYLGRRKGHKRNPSTPSRISSGMPAIQGATQGSDMAIASIRTTGIPSAKLEKINASAAA